MSKKSKGNPKFKDANYSRLADHRRSGKRLIPPLNALPNNFFSSWRDDHAPEMLWAVLLASVLPRNDYLECFRQMVDWMRRNFPPDDAHNKPHDEKAFVACEVDQTSLAALSDHHFEGLVRVALTHPLGYSALRPLLLIDCLPGLERWRKVLAIEPAEGDWQTLSSAVVHTLDHQSEKSTDVRWLKYVLKIALGKAFFPREMKETVEEIVYFPNKGDMRKVRPSIRAFEITLRRNPPSAWIAQYWALLLEKTPCLDASTEDDYFRPAVPTLHRDAIISARRMLAQRFRSVTHSTRSDARLDSTFGLAFYSLSLLEEVAAPPISQLILGRLGLRSLVEVAVTFAYLLKQDSPTAWKAYRAFGNGQAKLAFLKLEQATGDAPSFVDQDTLFQIANEDSWQEFADVNLGHWAQKNLRALSEQSRTKHLYDKYYDWTSSYVHGHWGSVRDSNFSTCHNPLHRLHRIPRPFHRLMPSVVRDAADIINFVLGLLEAAYPEMEKVGRIILDATVPEQSGHQEQPKA